jgi:hypothetical protein
LLDWRGFFQWQLDVEKTLLSRSQYTEFEALWDSTNPQAIAAMAEREQHPTQATPQVQAVAINSGPDGIPTASVQTTLENQPLVVTFRLVGGSWKRSG